MVIYLDVLAAVNLAMDYLLLLATARIAGVFVPRVRLLIGAAVGAAYAVCAVLPATTFLQHGLCELAAGVGMVALVFAPCKGRLMRVSVVFGLVSCACAGAVMALGQATGAMLRVGGAYYLDVPLRVVVPSALLCWCASGLLFRGTAGQNGAERPSAQAELAFAGKRATVHLLCDTGNTLCEPVTGRPALLLDRYAAARLLPSELAGVVSGLRSDNAGDQMASLPDAWRTRFCLLPYRAVGQNSGLLLAFRLDDVHMDAGKTDCRLAAISAQPIAGGRYDGLIGV